jgi:hypothetical protein
VSTAGRRAEFFALEANEYLNQLAPLAAAHEAPDAERLVRGSRSLRGAALMAGLGTYARAAAGLEAIARQVRDHALAWEPHARDGWTDGLATLRGLLGRAASWEAADDRQALTLAERLERVAAGLGGEPPQPPPPALTPGVRAFIARESALIAGSLEQAARALAPVPPPAALTAVLERMQSLRGIGASTELSPLPELLDAMEITTRSLLADLPAPPDVAAVFSDAARAMATMARAVADSGRVVPPAELQGVARRLLESFVAGDDVVPIETLAPAGAGSVVQAGASPRPLATFSEDAGDAGPVPVELVGVGDHLLLVADALAHPGSPAARDLRLFVLYRTLMTMPARSGTGRFLAPLARSIARAIASQAAAERPDAFLELLRDCGHFLVDAGSATDRQAVVRQRDVLTSAFTAVSGARVSLVEPPPPVLEREIVPIEALAPQPDEPVPGVVPVESLAPDRGDFEADVVPIESLAPDRGDFDADVVPIESLAPDRGDFEEDVVPIESLAPDRADFEADVVPIESLAPDTPPVPEIAPGEPSLLERAFARRRAVAIERGDEPPALGILIGAEIVPIESLLYRGAAALARAEEIRTEILTMLDESTVSLPNLRPFITELLDLVPLARDAA